MPVIANRNFAKKYVKNISRNINLVNLDLDNP